MLSLIGYGLALLMGLILGVIGAGGSILTVPILVYFLQVPPVTATGYSLLIVGCTALIGAWRYCMRGLVNFKTAATFMLPAMVSVLLTRAYIVPALPDPMNLAGMMLAKNTFIMLLFGALMLAAATFMLRPIKVEPVAVPEVKKGHLLKLIGGSAGIGILTGMVGAGGGFLIIPTLIGLFGLQVKEAVGTSLAIIAVNSLVGFNGDISHGIVLNWHLLRWFLLLTSAGMLAGTSLSHRIHAAHLRRLFGWFVLIVACALLADNLFLSK